MERAAHPTIKHWKLKSDCTEFQGHANMLKIQVYLKDHNTKTEFTHE